MPINAYTGLMGSGKSYECVVSVILPALIAGRRIVTNVDGIDNEACKAYCHEKHGIAMEKLGNIVHCSNEQVKSNLFLPFGTDTETFCQPGDMVCIDEAWRFWGTDQKILENHAIFFREHRHYVHPETKVSCDLVLMVQDISDLNRKLKVVVEVSFKTTKIKSLGLSKVYRVEMWEGYKLIAKGRVSVENKTYDPQIFPLYSSYSGGAGNELQVDKRQNILNSKKLWLMASAIVVLGAIGAYGVMHFFNPSSHTKSDSKRAASTQNTGIDAKSPAPAAPSVASVVPISESMRVVGSIQVGNLSYVAVGLASGRVRLEHPSVFQNSGAVTVGEVDGQRVTYWSGVALNPDAKQVLNEVKK